MVGRPSALPSAPSPLSPLHCQHVWSEIKFDVPVCNTSFLATIVAVVVVLEAVKVLDRLAI